MQTIGFVGAPRSQTIASQLLARNDLELTVWNPLADAADGESGPQAYRALAATPLILFSVPLNQARVHARRLGDILTGRHILLHTIRGVEPETLKPVSQILQEETPTQRLGFLTGPIHPSDLSDDRAGAAVCASLFPEVHDLAEEALISSALRLYRSQDLVGAEFSAAYARIIALISGLAEGLQLGYSLKSTLFARGLAEMARFVVFQEGFERTTFGLSGAGNLYLDTQGEGSLDFQLGKKLATTNLPLPDELVASFGEDARELLAMMRAFKRVGDKASLPLHLLTAAHRIVDENIPAADVLSALMQLPTLYE